MTIKPTEIMKKFVLGLFMAILVQFSYSQESKKDSTITFKTLDNISLNQKVFTVKVKYGSVDFNLQICKKGKCKDTDEYSKGITSDMLSQDVINLIKSEVDTTIVDSLITLTERSYINQLSSKVKDHILKLEVAKKSEEQRITDATSEPTSLNSGMLILHKTAQFKIGNSGNQGSLMVSESHADDTLVIKEALLQFFNNKASTIFIQAELVNGNQREEINFINHQFSIPLRAFNYDNYTLSAKAMNGEYIVVDINHVFNYINDSFFNYSIANGQLILSHKIPDAAQKPIKQRNFFDFFTAVIYSDVMAFNSENSNSLLNAQATLLVPLNQKNGRQWTATRQFITSANISLNNSFENESRFISFTDDGTVNHFDLFKKNNLNGLIALDIITYESKGWFLNTSLGYKATFYRTGFKYTATEANAADVVTNGQLLSIAHGPYLNFEIRPQTNFGADVTFSIEDLNYNDDIVVNGRDVGNDVLINNDHNNFIFKHNLVNVSASFYWLTNPSKSDGGVYARIGAAYHTPTDAIFPQLMVGYATNLTSFVNRFKSKEKESTTN